MLHLERFAEYLTAACVQRSASLVVTLGTCPAAGLLQRAAWALHSEPPNGVGAAPSPGW
jgi:hypothetical protein